MATTHQDTNVNQLVINKCTKSEFDAMSTHSETELFLVEESIDDTPTENSTNPVSSGAVYEALQDIGGNINDGTTTFTKNNETIGTTSANQSANQTIVLPNDVVMCNLIDNKALASYATPITRFKYIEDHGWVDMDRSNIQYNEGTGEWTGTFVSLDITEGEYYYDMDNDTVFVADENSEMQDVTSTVIIQGDSNKLYCDITTNMLYRYDGTGFIALTSNFSGSYNDLTDKLQNATTSTAGLMSANDKDKLNGIAIGAEVNPTVSTTTTSGVNCAKYGRLCFLSGYISDGSSVTLSAAYKPAQLVYFTAVGGAGSTKIVICRGYIDTNGVVYFAQPVLSVDNSSISFNPSSFPVTFSVAYLAAN